MWIENTNYINQNKNLFNKIILNRLKHILCGFIQNERFESQYTHILLIYTQETPMAFLRWQVIGVYIVHLKDFLFFTIVIAVLLSQYLTEYCALCDIMCRNSIGSILTIYCAWCDIMCFNSIGPILTKYCASHGNKSQQCWIWVYVEYYASCECWDMLIRHKLASCF